MQDEIAVTVIAAGFEKGREAEPALPERPPVEPAAQPAKPVDGTRAVPRNTADFSNTLEMDIPDFLKR